MVDDDADGGVNFGRLVDEEDFEVSVSFGEAEEHCGAGGFGFELRGFHLHFFTFALLVCVGYFNLDVFEFFGGVAGDDDDGLLFEGGVAEEEGDVVVGFDHEGREETVLHGEPAVARGVLDGVEGVNGSVNNVDVQSREDAVEPESKS